MAATARPTIGHVPALDGIRGLAVAAVVVFHLDRLPGGYLGVDAFFVLSGYLITRLLITEMEGTGRISLGRFYSRRARRLFPALLVLLVAVAVWGRYWAFPDELSDLRGESLASLFYAANWHAIAGADAYWDRLAAPSPLEHLWSLAIEEQFYFIWPLMVIGLLRIGKGSARIVGFAAAGLGAASALAMIILHGTGDDPNRVYLGTDTRAQSILIGATAAVLLQRGVADATRRALSVAAPLATLALALMWWRADGQENWLYEGGFALHALLVAIVISAAVTSGGTLGRILSWRPFTALGLVSYGLYLWHWPIIVWATPDRVGVDGIELDIVRVAISLAVTIASYFLIEQPIRYGKGFTPRRVLVATPVAFAACALVLAAWTAPVKVDIEELAVPPPPVPTVPSTSSIPPASIPGEVEPSPTTTVPARRIIPLEMEPGVAPKVLYIGDSIAAQVGPVLGRVLRDVAEPIILTQAGASLCDGFDTVDEYAGTADVLVIDYSGNAFSPCMLDDDGVSLSGDAYDQKHLVDTTRMIDTITSAGGRVMIVEQPVNRRNEPAGTAEVFRQIVEADTTGLVDLVSTWPAISPDGQFVQAASCDAATEPGCVDGEGEVRSRPPGVHLEPLGEWRYALAVRDALAADGWLAVTPLPTS